MRAPAGGGGLGRKTEGRKPTENGMHNLKSCQRLCPFCPFADGGIDGFMTGGGECLHGADEDYRPQCGGEGVVGDEVGALERGHARLGRGFCSHPVYNVRAII